MTASRRCPRPTPASASTTHPLSSGPRWASVAVMVRRCASSDAGSGDVRSQTPVMPHTAGDRCPRCPDHAHSVHGPPRLVRYLARSGGTGARVCGGGTVDRDTGQAAIPRGCRVVTTSMTARLLLQHQLRQLREISWSVVSGDAFDDPPGDVEVEVVPLRREFALSDVSAFVALLRLFRRRRYAFVQTHTPKASFLGLPAARLAGTRAVYTIHGA